MNKEIDLPSGAKLQITLCDFETSKNLYEQFLIEIKDIKWDSNAEMDVNFFKDIFCASMSSKRIQSALKVCMEKALYNKKKIEPETFEPVEAREDYYPVCYEVAKENILPFTKSLYAKYAQVLASLKSFLA